MRAPSAKLRTCFDQLRLSGVGLALMLLAGCQKSFDERYADAEKKVREQAQSIDQELAAKASEAAMGEASGTPVVEESAAVEGWLTRP